MFDTYTRKEVLTRLFERWSPTARTELCPTDGALGRVVTENIYSRSRQPVVRASLMDGIAVRGADFDLPVGAMPETSRFIQGADYARAGTGGDFDDRFDTIIAIEDVIFDEAGGFSLAPGLRVLPGMNVEPSGAALMEGDLLIRAGRRLRPIDIAVCVRGGHTSLPVAARPKVAFIPTGNELIPPGRLPARGEVTDVNSALTRHMLGQMGAEVILFPIVRDQVSELSDALDDAIRDADIVIINGGSSKCKDDLNASLLKARPGVELICHGVAAAPGRPLCVAVIEGKPVINVPGPMICVYYVYDWCLREIIVAFHGTAPVRRTVVRAKLTSDMTTPENLEFLNRLLLRETPDGFEATPLSLYRGEDPYIIGAASGQFVNAIGRGLYAAGTEIEVELLCDPAELPYFG